MKKLLVKILPMKVILFLLTIKHFYNNYSIISYFANFERKIIKNTELGDEEYYQFEQFLHKVPIENKTYVDIGAGNGVNSSCTLQLAKNDDIILIAGKGHEKYQEINGVRYSFDDVKIIEKLLK